MKRIMVKFFIILSIAMLNDKSVAQTYYCDRPSQPDIPSGYYEGYWEMENARNEMDEYIDDMNEYIDCLTMERDDAVDEANRAVSELDDAIQIYNSR